MIKNARIENEYLIFEGSKGYYNIDLGAIDMFGQTFSTKMQIIASNGRCYVDNVADEEYAQLKDLILSDSRFLMLDEYAIINVDNVKRCSVRHDHLDFYSLDIQFFQLLNVLGSKTECENMKIIIDKAIESKMDSEIETKL